MRVGLVCPYDLDHPGGVQGQVLGLARQLARRGHAVSVLAPGSPDRSAAAGPSAADPAGPTVVGAGRSLAVPANGSVARLALGPAVPGRVADWLARTRPEVVHVHEPGTPGLAASTVRRARGAGVPVVVTFHAARPAHPTDVVVGPVLRRLLGPLAHATAVSGDAATLARDLYAVDPVVVPNGLDVDAHARAPAPAPAALAGTGLAGPRHGAVPTVLFLGRRDEPRKGLAVLAAALPALARAVPRVRLVVAGPGRARVPGAVDLGVVDEKTKRTLLHTCDVVVAPHTGRESFGIVLAEAMAAGTPVVASDLPAFAAVLGDAGLLVPARDPAALVRGLVRVLTDPARAADLRTRGAARAGRWDWQVLVPRWEALYDRACRGPRAGS